MTAATHARAMHGVIEPIQALAYFSPEMTASLQALGLEPKGQGYVAGRAAPLGEVGPGVATATFYNFNRALMEHALPGAWDIATPNEVLHARGEAMQATYEGLRVPADPVAEATDLAREAAAGTSFAGRPLAGANADVRSTGKSYGDLWQALTTLREHRGDGHIAALITADLGPVESIVLYSAWQSGISRKFLQKTRLWDDEAWETAVASLSDRGLMKEDALTPEGQKLRDDIENLTDEAARQPYEVLGSERTERLWELLHPMAKLAADAFPRPFSVPETFLG